MDLQDEWRSAIPEANAKWAEMWETLEDKNIERRPIYPDEKNIPSHDPAIGQPGPGIGIFPLRRECRDFILVIPGGAFLFKSVHEAYPVAEKFYEAGYNAAILDYRCRPYSNEVICADGIRGIRYLRNYAKNHGINDVRIITVGFSAGGILTSLINIQADRECVCIGDGTDRESFVPDAEIMIYGAFTDTGVTEHALKSYRRLCGYEMETVQKDASESIILRLPMTLPPAFMAQTDDDDPFFILDMASAWRKRGIPVEAHLFHGGCHGGGLYDGRGGAENNIHAAHWFELCTEWLKSILGGH